MLLIDLLEWLELELIDILHGSCVGSCRSLCSYIGLPLWFDNTWPLTKPFRSSTFSGSISFSVKTKLTYRPSLHIETIKCKSISFQHYKNSANWVIGEGYNRYLIGCVEVVPILIITGQGKKYKLTIDSHWLVELMLKIQRTNKYIHFKCT